MLANASLAEKFLWAFLFVLVLSYMAGTWLNRRRSKAISAWLQAGIGALGGHPAWKIIRSVSAGGQVNVPDPVPPFSQIQINYALLTRELPPLWAYEHLSGKRDLLAVRANLRSTPTGEIEALPEGGELARRLSTGAGSDGWQWSHGPAGLGIACRGEVDARLLAGVGKFLGRYGEQVQRLSVRRNEVPQNGLYLGSTGPGGGPGVARPELMLFMSIGEPARWPAAQLLNALRDLARSSQVEAKIQR